MFPKQIKEIVGDLCYTIDTIGRSDNKVYIFENTYILKVTKDLGVLKREYEKNLWLYNHIPCARPILYLEEDGITYYLRGCVRGASLVEKKFLDDPKLLVCLYKKAIDILRKVDKEGCPFHSLESEGNSFVHGDLCLPNIFITEDNEIAGFIDLDNAGLGDPWFDYAWALWSMEYNLKTNQYNQLLLDTIGITYNDELFKKYIPEECLKKIKGMVE